MCVIDKRCKTFPICSLTHYEVDLGWTDVIFTLTLTDADDVC